MFTCQVSHLLSLKFFWSSPPLIWTTEAFPTQGSVCFLGFSHASVSAWRVACFPCAHFCLESPCRVVVFSTLRHPGSSCCCPWANRLCGHLVCERRSRCRQSAVAGSCTLMSRALQRPACPSLLHGLVSVFVPSALQETPFCACQGSVRKTGTAPGFQVARDLT